MKNKYKVFKLLVGQDINEEVNIILYRRKEKGKISECLILDKPKWKKTSPKDFILTPFIKIPNSKVELHVSDICYNGFNTPAFYQLEIEERNCIKKS